MLWRGGLARPLSSRYSYNFHRSICSTETVNEPHHHSDTKSKRTQYDRSVNKLVSVFDTTFIDPFDVKRAPEKLVNFATGIHASDEVEQSMMACLTEGRRMLEEFVSERLVEKADGSEPPSKSFFNAMSRSKVKTMRNTEKKKSGANKPKQTISCAVMFQRLLAINSYKKVPSERVFSFENTFVPLSMFAENGKMIKAKKSDFMLKLEELLPETKTSIQKADAIIFDGMAIVQSLPVHGQHSTFNDMAVAFLQYMLMKARTILGIRDIHVVFDKYTNNSPKTETREGIGDFISSKSIHVHGARQIPKDWKIFLSNSINKHNLSKFYTGFMKETANSYLNEGEAIIINGCTDETCIRITPDGLTGIPELNTKQEEADTIMVLHARYEADKGSSSVVVHTPDTDVLVLLLHHYANIGTTYLYMSTGRVTSHTDLRRYIPVHSLRDILSSEQLNILMVSYCLTGCDTTSAFYRKGKKTVFKLIMKDARKYHVLKYVGDSLLLTKTQRAACIQFVVDLYGGGENQTLNRLRCLRAKHSTDPRNLPPTEDSFSLHCLRCVYQLFIWKNALKPIYDMPPPVNFGFESKDCVPGLWPKLMNQSVAAPELLNDMTCECLICNETCSCFVNQQPCTVACSCTGNYESDSMACTNVYTLSMIFHEEGESSDNDEENVLP